MRYLKVQEVTKGPRGTYRFKRYLQVQEGPKGPRGIMGEFKSPGFSMNVASRRRRTSSVFNWIPKKYYELEQLQQLQQL